MTDEERANKLYTRIAESTLNRDLVAFNLVYDNIYVGGAKDVNFFVDATFPSVDAVLNLRAENQVTIPAKATLWMPVWDRPPFPGIPWLATAVDFLESNQEMNWTTYIHCNLGFSRSGMVMVAFLMKKEKLKMEKAWQVVSTKRPCGPNPAFLVGLIEWERYLEGKD